MIPAGLEKFKLLSGGKPAAVALGTFDGVHSGHRAVIKNAVDSAYLPVALVIERPEKSYIKSPLLTLPDTREKLLKYSGISTVITVEFEEIHDLSPEEFVRDVLKTSLNARLVCCGFNFHFGKNAAGNTKTLKELCKKYDIELIIAEPVFDAGEPVSSSRIRTAVENGCVDAAAEMLGHHFGFDFEVVGGDKLGRRLGSPTINQPLPQEFVRPKYGVYAAVANIDGKKYAAVCNIGVRPTVRQTLVRAETYILDFSGDLYGRRVPVELVRFLRPEIKFPSLQALKEAISNDASAAKEIICKQEEKYNA